MEQRQNGDETMVLRKETGVEQREEECPPVEIKQDKREVKARSMEHWKGPR